MDLLCGGFTEARTLLLLTDEAVAFHLAGPGGPHARFLLWVSMNHRHAVPLRGAVRSSQTTDRTTYRPVYGTYRCFVVMRPAVVERLSGSPVGVAEQPGLGPLEMADRVGGQAHPKVDAHVL